MQSINSFKSKIFQVNNQTFERDALELFHFQYNNNKIYHEYLDHLSVNPDDVNSVSKIPFLPIRFFKSHVVKTGDFLHQQIFESSGTTGVTSKHYIEDLEFYNKISTWIFSYFFGELHNSTVIGLLPSYLERGNSSLVHMVNHFILESKNTESGFYLNNLEDLVAMLKSVSSELQPIYLFGVTFALLDLAERYALSFENLTVLETGGMKGRGKELIREELHLMLKGSFETDKIYSEYGMTELLSQAYMKKDGLFFTPPWMKIQIREIHDPFCIANDGKSGIIKVIDLANIHSCAFIETEDLGILEGSGFRVLGRLDNSDLRGCNLLLS